VFLCACVFASKNRVGEADVTVLLRYQVHAIVSWTGQSSG
jgi:hypothetical protein